MAEQRDSHAGSPPDSLRDLLAPLPPEALGWMCLGYHAADAPGRAELIRDLLVRSSIVPAHACAVDTVSAVLHRVLRQCPNCITLQPCNLAALQPISLFNSPTSCHLVPASSEWLGFAGDGRCACGRAWARWRAAPAVFMTLARGMLRGTVLFLRCAACKTVAAGTWQWSNVPENSKFPDGFHRPVYVPPTQSKVRWFFATPQVCWETSLLQWLFGSMARGGMTATAIFCVYRSLWASTLQGLR